MREKTTAAATAASELVASRQEAAGAALIAGATAQERDAFASSVGMRSELDQATIARMKLPTSWQVPSRSAGLQRHLRQR